ncbi:MAG: sigma 54-interacting transcriptional regulator [Vicinamibacteria bacterium]
MPRSGGGSLLLDRKGRGSLTLFLDEIGEMAPTIQAKLLRALQEREIRKVGGERDIRVNPRVIAATNRDLRATAAGGAFRDDLYFRLGAFVITVPPLRDRREEIPALTHQFLRAAALHTKKDVQGISAEAMALLMRHPRPGNVRELEHTIERAVILAHTGTVGVRELPSELRAPIVDTSSDESLDLEQHERNVIQRAFEHFGWNRTRAAKALKISTVTLWRRMKQHGIVEPQGR